MRSGECLVFRGGDGCFPAAALSRRAGSSNVSGSQVPEWLLLAVAAAAIAARLYLRLALQKKRLTASDILMCCAWVAAAGSAAFDIKFATMGVLDAGNIGRFTAEDLQYTLQVSAVAETRH